MEGMEGGCPWFFLSIPEVHKHRLWVLPQPFPPEGFGPPSRGHPGRSPTLKLVSCGI